MLPNRSLNPHQSVSRINGCIKPELTTSFPLCIWPLCIISSSTKGFLYMSPCMHLTNQTPTMVLVGQGLRAAQVHYSLVCTPLAPYWNIVYLSWTRGKCWEIGNWQSWEREEKEMGGSWEGQEGAEKLPLQGWNWLSKLAEGAGPSGHTARWSLVSVTATSRFAGWRQLTHYATPSQSPSTNCSISIESSRPSCNCLTAATTKPRSKSEGSVLLWCQFNTHPGYRDPAHTDGHDVVFTCLY